MCGIAGVVHADPTRPAEPRRVQRMIDSLSHRGPDDEGLWHDGPAALGHRRLSIIDVAGGHQPMSNEDGSIWIVFNGEIYNHVELREELAGRHGFRTRSDTEVIVHLYEEMGEACLEKLNGMFAFAIWDGRRQRLFAARDRLGIKPFYWSFDGERFAFASEPKALLAAGYVRPEMDSESLEQYLCFQFCLDDRTLFRGIHQLEPGHRLTFSPQASGPPRVARYWRLDHEIDWSLGEDEAATLLRELLTDAVRLQLRSDVPVGAHLSGGIDSSSIVCLASALHAQPLHSFTGAFSEGPEFDESGYARIVADHAGTHHHEVRPTADEMPDLLPRLMYFMDEPAAGPGLIPQFRVSQLARQHVKVVLGGQGGDELFAGYARYLVAYLEQCLKGSILDTREEGRYVVSWETIEDNLPMLRDYAPLIKRFWSEGLFDDMDRRYFRLVNRVDDAATLFSPDFWRPESEQRVFGAFRAVFDDPATPSYITKMTQFDLRTQLPALLQVEDRSSMAASLESRVPLLDHRIVELVFRLPPAIRFRNGHAKHLFHRAVDDLLPIEIRERRDKMGFPVPLSEWLRGPLHDYARDILVGPKARARGLVRTDSVAELLDSEPRFSRQSWGLLCLELWCRTFLDGDGVASG